MKIFLVILVLVGLGYNEAMACTTATIDSIVSKIDPYYRSDAGPQVQQSLQTLELCDENLYYAGFKIGTQFDVYYEGATYDMANVVIGAAKSLPADLRQGLGLALIQRADLYYHTLGFGTTGAIQSLGVPYMIHRDQTLLAEEVLAPEILGALRGGNSLDILVRMDSGESNLNLKFTLKGSSKAISELLQVCH